MKKIIHLFRTFALLILAGVLCCCADDRDSFRLPDDPHKEVTFSVQIPVPSLPSTYGLNATSENEVRTIDILLFSTATGNLTGSTLSANSIANSGSDNSTKTFTVKIPEGTYTVVILANCRDILSAAMPGITADANKSKANVLSKLQVSLPTGASGAWVADALSGSYKPIPMWGEMLLIVSSTTPATNNMKLTRMLAKIDVSVNGSLRNDFKLTSVRLYNRYTRGAVAPVAANWNAAQNKVTAPSPLGSASTIALLYTVPAAGEAQFLNEIYTFEAPAYNSTPVVIPEHTCLIIGGKYKGSAETFYRVDFAKITGNTVTYLPLLRNHRYDVDIKSIESMGYVGFADALLNKPVNIEADITVFDESKITKTVYDDQNMLGVSNDNIAFTREARTLTHPDNTLSVTTDVVTGWKVDKVVDATTGLPVTWVSLNPDSKTTAGTTDTKLILSDNTSGSPRSAVIHLIAGRLTLPVTITQTTASALMLSLTNASNVEITDLVFAAKSGDQPPMQSVKLSWMPVDKTVAVSTAAFGGTGFVYATGGGLATPGIGAGTGYTNALGAMTLDIRPTAFIPPVSDPFQERISKVDFTVNNGMNYISKSVFFRQFAYNFLVEETTGFYRLDGSTYTLRIKSNVGWKISSISESLTAGSGSLLNLAASDNLKINTSGGFNTNPGTDIKFRVTNNVSNLRGKLTIKFESTDSPKRFNDYTLTLDLMGEYYPAPHNGWAGSNIYWDGSKLTFDDVNATTHQNYQGLFFQWGSLWGIAPNGAQNSAWTTSNTVYRTSGGAYTSSTGYSWANLNTYRVNDTSISSSPPSGRSERDRAYLYELADEVNGRGDICKFLTKMGYAPGSASGTKWRMPTSNEFESASSYARSGSSWSTQTSNSPSGLYENTYKPGYSKPATSPGTYTTAFFPAAGCRSYGSGAFSLVGSGGHYWSGSPYSSHGYFMVFNSSLVSPISYTNRSSGFSVRCVKE